MTTKERDTRPLLYPLMDKAELPVYSLELGQRHRFWDETGYPFTNNEGNLAYTLKITPFPFLSLPERDSIPQNKQDRIGW